jgi:hypothetical protein
MTPYEAAVADLKDKGKVVLGTRCCYCDKLLDDIDPSQYQALGTNWAVCKTGCSTKYGENVAKWGY